MNRNEILTNLSPAVDQKLFSQLLDDFIDQEERFVLRDWKPATLDGGRFAETAARIQFHLDTGTLNATKPFDECVNFVDDLDRFGSRLSSPNPHKSDVARLQALRHIVRVLRMIYKLRSQRGAVHVSPDYDANELDSRLIIESCRWVLAELLRLSWTGPSADIAEVVRELLTFEIPIVARIGMKTLVMRTDLSVPEEILVLLYSAGEKGLPNSEIYEAIPVSKKTVDSALARLAHKSKREILIQNKHSLLTQLGAKRVREELGSKLVLS